MSFGWKKQYEAKLGEPFHMRMKVHMADVSLDINNRRFKGALAHSSDALVVKITEGKKDVGTYVLTIENLLMPLFKKIIEGKKIPMEAKR